MDKLFTTVGPGGGGVFYRTGGRGVGRGRRVGPAREGKRMEVAPLGMTYIGQAAGRAGRGNRVGAGRGASSTFGLAHVQSESCCSVKPGRFI